MKLRLMVTSLLIAATSAPLFASTQSHNLNFEQTQNDKLLNWTLAANSKQYETKLEQSQVQEGKYSASITFTGDKTGYEAWSYSIPSIYKGSKVTLKGFLKTENITKGRAGLMIHVGPPFKSSYMENVKVSGTNDWQEYEISVDSDLSKAKEIRVGAALIGNGKVWVDNLTVLIDGVPLSKAAKKELPPAKLDDEFNDNSRIKIANLNAQSIADLAFLGKLWGFLKYHHPEIAKGKFNWDFELFRVLPTYLAAKNDKQREAVLTKWIQKLGEVKDCVTCPVVDKNARLKPSLAWLTESNYSDDFKALVKHIFVNRHQGDSYYISHKGRTNFTNENPYNNQADPDLGFRLLAVYRYWNYVNYYYPYKDLIVEDWDKILVDSIKKAHQASSEFEYEMVMVGMIKKIKDSHALISKGFDKVREHIGHFVPPVLAKYIESQVVVTDFYAANEQQLIELKAASNLQIGDVITHIEGRTVADLIEERKQFYSASNDSRLMLSVTAGLLRSSKQQIKIDLLRAGKKESVLLPLYEQEELDYTWSTRPKHGPSVKAIDEDIAYYWLETLEQEDLKKIEEMLVNSKGFIADMRGYPQTKAESWKVFANVLEKPTSLLSWVSKQSSTPGEFRQGLSAKYPNAKNTYRGPVVVLVDANTQSFSESLVMGFQAGVNTITMGTQSSGANGQGSLAFTLPGGLYTIFSGSGAYYTDGTQMQQVGVKIDKIVEPTVKGIREGRDEVLEAAIAYIKEVSKQQNQVSP